MPRAHITNAELEELKRRGIVITEGPTPKIPMPEASAPKAPREEPEDMAELVAAIAAAGLPAPTPEFTFDPGRHWRFDLAWPYLFVAFEREGGRWVKTYCKCGKPYTSFKSRHHDRKGLENDCLKYNAAAVAGWLVVRATPQIIKSGSALASIAQALRSRAK
jgi:hypothetical protein